MPSSSRILLLFFLSLATFIHSDAILRRQHEFFVREASYTRLCATKDILTVNGQFPGPTLYAYEGDTIYVKVHNHGSQNITIHWHGVEQPRNPWSDGPEYITQCPIQPGDSFTYKIIFSVEVGTLWWHAHSDWSRATVHGAIVLHPKRGTGYPFPKPHQEVPIILGEWWDEDIREVLEEFVGSGGGPRNSDAYTINGQPGDLYPCSTQDTFKLNVTYGKRYLLHMVNAQMDGVMFFSIANHSLTVVAADGSYTKPVTTDYVLITPGQTLDCLLEANQVTSGGRFYMAAKAYISANGVPIDNSTKTFTAIIQYDRDSNSSITNPEFPTLPNYNDTNAAYGFLSRLRSLDPLLFPLNKYDTRIISTVAVNTFPCEANNTCAGPNGTRLAASMNNISFHLPSIDILEAYYYHINGVFGTRFPSIPPYYFNFTGPNLPATLLTPKRATEVRLIKYNLTVELVFQNTRLLGGLDHPMHLHGYSFYIVGWGFGNFNESRDPLNYNLLDPPYRNTVLVPLNGWAAVRFKANNPGVWYLHCHLERHLTWGMDTVFIVKEGNRPEERILPPPRHMPRC